MDESEGAKDQLVQADGMAEETLRLLETLHSSAPVGFGFIDRDFRYVRVNEKLATINGHPMAEHLGRRVDEMVPDLWPEIEPLYQRVLHSGESFVNVELSGRTEAEPDRVRHWATSFYPVHSQGVIIGIGVLVTDITERKEAEAALHDLTRATITALASTVETRDPYTAGHQRRVAHLSAAVAAELGLDPDTVNGIRLSANIHDIGKIGIPAEILTRPGRLRAAELELIQDHCRAGYEIMKGVTFPWPVADMIVQHHERLDGSGYPAGLRGTEISVGARIIAVTDTVEAMASHRPYRAGLGIDMALAQVEAGRGIQFDPDVVDTCLDLFRTGRAQVDV